MTYGMGTKSGRFYAKQNKKYTAWKLIIYIKKIKKSTTLGESSKT